MIVIGIDPGQKHWGYFVVGEGVAFGGEGPTLDWTGKCPPAVGVLRTWLQQTLLAYTDWPESSVMLGIERQFAGQKNIRMETSLYTIAHILGLHPEVVTAREAKETRHKQLPANWRSLILEDVGDSDPLHIQDAAWVAYRTADTRGILAKLT